MARTYSEFTADEKAEGQKIREDMMQSNPDDWRSLITWEDDHVRYEETMCGWQRDHHLELSEEIVDQLIHESDSHHKSSDAELIDTIKYYEGMLRGCVDERFDNETIQSIVERFRNRNQYVD